MPANGFFGLLQNTLDLLCNVTKPLCWFIAILLSSKENLLYVCVTVFSKTSQISATYQASFPIAAVCNEA